MQNKDQNIKNILSSEDLDLLKPPKSLPTITQNSSKNSTNTQVTDKNTAKTKKIRKIIGYVAKATQETSDTWTLHVFVADADKDYKAGQFLSIAPHQFTYLKPFVDYLEHEKGRKEPIRAYSMASSPSESFVSFTIKPEDYHPKDSKYPPLLSPVLASDLLVGKTIEFTGYSGAYVLHSDQVADIEQVIHLVAGSGIVPNYAIIKDQLINNRNPHLHHTLLYVNKSYEDIIFHKQLKQLQNDYPNQLTVVNLLTRCDKPQQYGNNFFKGRPTLERVRHYINDIDKTMVFACGPAITKWQRLQAKENNTQATPRFMESVKEIITNLKIDKKRFKHEDYG